MDMFILIGFIIFGLALVVVEVIFVPGTTIVWLLGLASISYGVYLGYEYFGSEGGTTVLVMTLVLGIATVVYSLKSRTWEKLSLKTKMEGKVHEEKLKVNLGDIGTTFSSLKPVGRAFFNGEDIEVTSISGFIEERKEIKIIRIDKRKIFVQEVG